MYIRGLVQTHACGISCFCIASHAEVRHAKLSSWKLVVCGTGHHPYQPVSVATVAGRPQLLHSNEAKPSYAVHAQQQPHVRPSPDFHAVNVEPCQKPTTTRHDSTLAKIANSGGKAVTLCKHEML